MTFIWIIGTIILWGLAFGVFIYGYNELLEAKGIKINLKSECAARRAEIKSLYHDKLTIRNEIEQVKQEYVLIVENLDNDLKEKEQLITLELEKIDRLKLDYLNAKKSMLKEAKDNFNTLTLSPQEKNDVKNLLTLEGILHNPRALYMLIWSTFFQKKLKALSIKVLDTSAPVCGIYKITNINTKECYIGQSVDIAKRWNDHCKHGLGIDTPQGNKLYEAMNKYGVDQFSWELLEVCEKKQLNDKEREYIDIFSSVDYGYNSNKGNK